MPPYRGCREKIIDATPAECFAALTDYETLPSWQSGLKRATVVETRADAVLVEYEVDAVISSVTYRMWHRYEPDRFIDSEYVSGPFRSMSGNWRFEPVDGGTHVRVEIELDPGRRIPRPITRMIQERVLGRAVADLEKHLTGQRATT